MEVKNEFHAFQWIINEGLLRDEGTLLGSRGGHQRKDNGYPRLLPDQEGLGAGEAGTIEKDMNVVQSDLEALLAEINDPDDKHKRANLVPVVLQLVLYGGICYFNFFLESYWLSPVIQSAFICAGLYCFGLFSVFWAGVLCTMLPGRWLTGRAPVKNGRHGRSTWRSWVFPLVVSIFICLLSANAHPIPISIISALFFFFLFLLGGKGLVNTFFRARTELGHLSQTAGKRIESKRKAERLNAMQGELVGVLTTIGELDGEEEYKIHILTSEYKLAFESRQLAASVAVKKSA